MATRFDDWEGQFLQHHGIKGQKWGVRRFQNPDGTLTSAGKAHYGSVTEGGSKNLSRKFNRSVKKLNSLAKKADVETQQQVSDKYKKRAKTAAGVTVALAGSAIGSQFHTAGKNAREANRLLSKADEFYGKALRPTERLGADTFRKYMREAEYYDNDSLLYKRQSSFTTAGASITTKILGAATVASGAYTAYAAARSKIAKNRTTEKGHAKAVKKYEKKYSKVVSQFKDTPYSAIIPENTQNKKKKSS